jgi:glyoxylase-like metal-dependent hydrolase (beta-lactamase superfamily II)/putative sterol carrier protein
MHLDHISGSIALTNRGECFDVRKDAMTGIDRVRQLVDERPWGEAIQAANATEAVEIAPRIYMSPGTSNAYMVLTDTGRVIVNTGLGFEAYTHKRLFDAICQEPTTHILVTQGHVDHVGGVGLFRDPDTLFVAQASNAACQADDERISERRQGQSYIWFADVIDEALQVANEHPDAVVQDAPTPDLTFEDRHELEVGGRRFVLLSTPGGETVDSCVVWLEGEGILFTGNLFGPLFPHFPNFNTIRGDKYRFADAYFASLARVRDLGPEILITGHGEPIRGKDLIRECLDRLEAAVRYVHDKTLEGINAGEDIDALAARITLPDDLYVGQGYGRVAWAVRTFWESYLGWFKLRSSIELYPRRPVAHALASLAGASATVAKARELLEEDPVLALGMAEAVLEGSPNEAAALRLALDAHEALLSNADDARNLWLGGWLRSQKASLEERLLAKPVGRVDVGEVRALMEAMPKRFVPTAAKGLTAVYQYELMGAQSGIWAVIVDNGTCRVQEGPHPSPDCRITMKDVDFLALNYGELHPLKAAMQGRIKFEGDRKKAIPLDKIFEKTKRPSKGGDTGANAKVLFVDDLNAPVLSLAQRSIKWLASKRSTRITVEGVLARAERRTGLADFGPRDFEARLRILVDDYNADVGMGEIGRRTVFGDLVRYASNRLLIQDYLSRHPEALEERIETPLIVVGLPRSGTTHLVNLLAADSRFRSLPLWEAMEPLPTTSTGVPSLATVAAVGSIDKALPRKAREWLGVDRLVADPRYLRSAANWAAMRTMVPYVAAMHPMNPDHVHEEIELMGPNFSSYTFEWTGHVPHYRDHYLATDQTPHYAYLKRLLQVLQHRDGGPRKPWVLKSPQHLEQLPTLLATFPDATIIFTHRDPVAVIQSTVTMLGYAQRIARNVLDMPGLLAYWTDRMERLLKKGVADRSLVPDERSYDSLFHELMADTEGKLEQIYNLYGVPRTARSRAEQAAFLEAHPRGKDGRVRYDLEGQFGTKPEVVRERFRFYLERFAVRVEV